MSDKSRAERWRQNMRDQGKGPVTLWLSHEDKERMDELARLERCTTSEVVSQALAHYQQEGPERTGNVTDTEQLREMIREEVAAVVAKMLTTPGAPSTGTATNCNVQATHTATNRNVSGTSTDTNRNVQETQAPHTAPEPLTFDTSKHYLGGLCKQGHDYQGTGKSLRNKAGGNCLVCKTVAQRARRRDKRGAAQR